MPVSLASLFKASFTGGAINTTIKTSDREPGKNNTNVYQLIDFAKLTSGQLGWFAGFLDGAKHMVLLTKNQGLFAERRLYITSNQAHGHIGCRIKKRSDYRYGYQLVPEVNLCLCFAHSKDCSVNPPRVYGWRLVFGLCPFSGQTKYVLWGYLNPHKTYAIRAVMLFAYMQSLFLDMGATPRVRNSDISSVMSYEITDIKQVKIILRLLMPLSVNYWLLSASKLSTV